MNPQDFKIRASQCWKIMSNAKTKGELSQTCKTYLESWYSNDNEEIYSKYMDKGNQVESELIDFMAQQLGYGLAEKCRESASNEFMQGSCDVVTIDAIIDVKASYNRNTLHKQVIEGLKDEYYWQMLVYLELYKRDKGIIFHGLMNTPSTDWSDEIVYEDMPENERWIAYQFNYDIDKITAIKERVEMCRAYLIGYDKLIKSKLGTIS
jgi:hypothetical protein